MSPFVIGVIVAIWIVLNFIYFRLGVIIRQLDEFIIVEEEEPDE